jgi:hypothetical protein
MPNQLRLKHNDFDGDAITNSIAVRDEDYATQDAKLDTLNTQIQAWLCGRLQSRDDIRNVVENGPGKAITPIAQGSTQLILEVEDLNTGVIYRERLAMPDLGKANDVGGAPAWLAVGQGQNSLTIINPDHDAWATLKTAYDAVGVSPEGNNTALVRAYIEE